MVVYSNQTLDKYHIDFETNNVSFLKMAATLRKMGVKNWYFFLKIYNKKLCNLNPYSKDLTFDERVAISKECAENRWYFYREVFRVGETGASTDEGGGSELWSCAGKALRAGQGREAPGGGMGIRESGGL